MNLHLIARLSIIGYRPKTGYTLLLLTLPLDCLPTVLAMQLRSHYASVEYPLSYYCIGQWIYFSSCSLSVVCVLLVPVSLCSLCLHLQRAC